MLGAANELLIPAIGLICVAWLVPKLLSMVMPEGIRPLIMLGILSALVVTVIIAGFFVVLYVQSGVPVSRILDLGPLGLVVFFGRLSLAAAIIWAPIMVLSVASLPRTWEKAIW